MKKVIFSIVVISMSISAFGAVNITMRAGSGVDCNLVTVAYMCTAGEEVRAFALRIAVTNKKFAVGSPVAISTDYYICPSSIQFAVSGDGETYISSLGSPVAQQDPNGGVIEMASLYAAGDPNHPTPPPSMGYLLKFRIIGNYPPNCGSSAANVTLLLDSQRGGIVLTDPNVIPTVTLPPTLSLCPTACGGCWGCPGQPYGDTNGDGRINATDYFNFKKSYGTASATHPHGTGVGQYNCCCDFNKDSKVNATDYFTFKKNYGKTGLGTCSDTSCWW